MSISHMTCSSGRLVVRLFDLLLRSPVVPVLDVSAEGIQQSRKSLDLYGRMMPRSSGVKVDAVEYGGVACEQHRPRSAPTNRVLVYFHGGGYCLGSPTSHRHLVSRLAKVCGMRALAVNYRKAPEHPYPAALDDAVAVYTSLLEEGIKPNNIFFAGDSAGGNLVVATLLQLKHLAQPLPAAAACLSPWLDFKVEGETVVTKKDVDLVLSPELLRDFAQHYTAGTHREEWEKSATLSPLAADLADLPPILIQVGSEEILLDDALRFAEHADGSANPIELQIWERMQHVWHFSYPMLKDGRRAISDIASFFDRNQ